MRKITINKKLNMPASFVWNVLTNIKEYPKMVKYMKKVEILGELATGKEWTDWTTILWVPMKIKHKTNQLVKNEKLVFEVPLPFNGKMNQLIKLTSNEAGTNILGEISFDLGNPIFNFFIGPILKARLSDMINYSLVKIKNYERKDS